VATEQHAVFRWCPLTSQPARSEVSLEAHLLSALRLGSVFYLTRLFASDLLPQNRFNGTIEAKLCLRTWQGPTSAPSLLCSLPETGDGGRRPTAAEALSGIRYHQVREAHALAKRFTVQPHGGQGRARSKQSPLMVKLDLNFTDADKQSLNERSV